MQFAVEIIQALLSAINYKIPIIIFDAKLSDDEMEQLKSLLYAISLSAEQTGFEVGVRFAVQLLIKLL